VRGKAITFLVLLALLWAAAPAHAQDAEPMPSLSDVSRLVQRVDEESPDTMAKPIKIVLLLTLLSVVPAVLILATSFTRIVIVLAFIRRALTTRNIPPAQVVVGLALFLSLFIMAPTLGKINARAIQPYLRKSITAEEAFDEGVKPLREFMFSQTAEEDLLLLVSISGIATPEEPDDVPTHVLIPSFVIGELKRAFELGFILYLPFLVIDLIVASVLLSMGMMMLPPVMVSAPLKILLFVLVDGWHLITESLMLSFGGS
jgi:flagellar biosynthetic protein FliP